MSVKLLATATGCVASAAVAAYISRAHRRSVLPAAEETEQGEGDKEQPTRRGEGDKEQPTRRGVKSVLTERGITGKKLTQALVVHECLGLCLFGGSWVLCYFVQPSSRLAAVLEQSGLQGATSKALGELGDAASKKVAKLFGGSGDTERLTKSLAESMLVRTFLTPFTMPLKLYLSYTVVQCRR